MNQEKDVFTFVGVKDRLKMFEQRSQENTSPDKVVRPRESRNENMTSLIAKTSQNNEIGNHAFFRPNQSQGKEVRFRITGIQKEQKPEEQPINDISKEPPQILAPPPKLSEVQFTNFVVPNSKSTEVKQCKDQVTPPDKDPSKIQQDQTEFVKYQTIQKILGKIDPATVVKEPHSPTIDTIEFQKQPTPAKTFKNVKDEEIRSPISELGSQRESEIQIKTSHSKIGLLSNDKIVHPVPPPPPPPPSKLNDNTSTLMTTPLPPPLPVPNIPQSKYSESSDKTNMSTHDDPVPPTPPPLPSLAKTTKKSNILVGWVTSSPDESIASKEICKEPINNIMMEQNKAPPIVVAPPTLESVRKITDRDQSSKLVASIRDSGASSVHSGDNEDDTYDNDDNDLNNEPWYFNVTKEEATALMRDATKKGSYMMRPSENGQYVLMVRTESKEIKKFKVQRSMNGWILGDPSNLKKVHDDLGSLMECYKTNGIKFGNSIISLKSVVPKK